MIAKSALSVPPGSILTVGYGASFFISTTRGISQVGRFVGSRCNAEHSARAHTPSRAACASLDRQIVRQQERSRTRSERLKNRRSAGPRHNDKAGNEEEKQGKSKEEKKETEKRRRRRSPETKNQRENEVEVGFDETA